MFDKNQHLDRKTFTLKPGLGQRVTDVGEKGQAGSNQSHEYGAMWWHKEFDPNRKE